MNIPKSKKSILVVRCRDDQTAFIEEHETLIKNLSSVTKIQTGKNQKRPSQSYSAIVSGMEFYLPLGGMVDLKKETARMEERITDIDRLILNINKKLNNKEFLKNAPERVINHEKSNLNKLTTELDKISSNLEMIQ